MRHGDRQIFIIGGNRLQSELLKDFFSRELGCHCLIEEGLHSIEERRMARCCKERLVLIDCAGMDRIQLTTMFQTRDWSLLAADYPVLFSMNEGDEVEQAALRYGVRGFFYLKEGMSALLSGVRAILNEELWIPRRELANYVMSAAPVETTSTRPLPGLGFRETEVLGLLAKGYSNKEIAQKLCISLFTVKAHLNHIFRKINVSNRLQAVRWREQFLGSRCW